MTKSAVRKDVGRPRSEATRQAILKAAMKLMEGKQFRDLTIDAFAREAKASRTTIYRWWPNKVAVIVDAIIEAQTIDVAIPETMGARQAMALQISQQIKFHQQNQTGRYVANIMAEAHSDPKILEAIRERFGGGQTSTVLHEIISRGQESGEFCRDINVDLTVEMIVATIVNRMLLAPSGLDEHFAIELPKLVLQMLEPATDRSGAGATANTKASGKKR